MTFRKTLLAGATALALTAAPLAATAQGALPEALSAIELSNVRDRVDDDGEREIRGFLPDGYRFEAEYDADGRVDEMKTERDSALPRPLLDAVLPAAVVEAIFAPGMMTRVHEIDVDHDDREVEIDGFGEASRIEATFSLSGRMLAFERERTGPRGHRDFGLSPNEARARAGRAGYTEIGGLRYERERVIFDAVNPDGEPVTVSMDEGGDVRREAAR